jgi:hypothetical protein
LTAADPTAPATTSAKPAATATIPGLPEVEGVSREQLLKFRRAAAQTAAAQTAERPLRSAPVSALRFEVGLAGEEALLQTLRVSATFRVDGREPVLLSLPAWTPNCFAASCSSPRARA